MNNVLVILRKEIKGYFVSPIAYALMAFYGIMAGYFCYIATAIFVQRAMESTMMGRGMPMSVNEWVIRPVLSNVQVLALFLIPMITMRLLAEEKRSGTMELLATSPIRDIDIILGKWLAALIMYSCIIGITLANVLLLFAYGKPDWRPMMVGFLGLVLQGAGMLAIGTFISATTRSQIVAGVATFATCLLLWVLEWVTAFSTAPWAKVVAYFSVLSHMEPFTKGVIDTKDVVFYMSVIFVGLFLTARAMESVRWRA